jgi:hypothetical protein
LNVENAVNPDEGEESQNKEVEEEEGFKWTQEKDEILIT